jgi:hypothetical protein
LKRNISLLLPALLLLTACGCLLVCCRSAYAEPTPWDEGPGGLVTEGLQLTAELLTPVVAPGQPVIIRLTCRNVTDAPVQLPLLSPEHAYLFAIEYPGGGKGYGPDMPGCKLEPIITLQPGSVNVVDLTLTGGDVRAPQLKFRFLKEGEYAIKAIRGVNKLHGEGAAALVSNPATLLVTSDPKLVTQPPVSPASSSSKTARGHFLKPSHSAPAFGPVGDGLQVGLASDKRAFVIGEKIVLTVVLRNSSDRRRWNGGDVATADWDVALTDASGKEMPLSAQGADWPGPKNRPRPDFLVPHHFAGIEPGEEERDIFVLTDFYDIGSAGRYTVKIGLSETGVPRNLESLRSAPLELTISAPSSP